MSEIYLSSPPKESKGKVIIIGAGVSGLSCGVFFHNAGYNAVIYERSSEMSRAGASISLAPNAVWVLENLGLAERFFQHAHRIGSFCFRQYSGETLFNWNIRQHLKENAEGRPYIIVTRAKCNELFLERLAELGVPVHWSKSFSRYERLYNGKVRVFFEDGSYDDGDILVGADGVNSLVRQQMMPQHPAPHYVGYTVTRGICRGYKLPDMPDDIHLIVTSPGWSEGKRLFMAALGVDSYYWFWCKNSAEGTRQASREAEKEKALEEMRETNFHIDFQRVIEHTDPAVIDHRDIHIMTVPEKWHNQNVVLVGDAAHCMSPEVGQGGAQSIEDAKVLVDCLVKHDGRTEDAFDDYVTIRRSRVMAVGDKALRNGKILSIENPFIIWLRTKIIPYIGVSLLKQQTFIWAHKA